MENQRLDAYPYEKVAWFYDRLADWYSRGRIEQSKRQLLEWVAPDHSVLFAGVGSGLEATLAAERGARVVAVDLSASMLSLFEKRLGDAGLTAQVVQADVASFQPEERFDVVVAHYFLNLFEKARVEMMLDRLLALVRPGGILVLADFSPPEGGWLMQVLSAGYYRLANAVAWLLGFCALHPVYDYEALLLARGMTIERVERFWVGSQRLEQGPAYLSIVARANDGKNPDKLLGGVTVLR